MSSHRLADMLDAADDFRTRMKEEGRSSRPKEPCIKCGSLAYKGRSYGIKPEMNHCDVCNPNWPRSSNGTQ